MTNILNITNGDCSVSIMEKAGMDGVLLPWRDILHEGPVPAGLSLEQLSEVRAEFLAARGWGEPEAIKRQFVERDNMLKSFEKYDRVLLWFEHDLYDQLQLLQILDWFNENTKNDAQLSLICTDQYLAMLSVEEMQALPAYEQPVTHNQLTLASEAWAAFRADSPENWCALSRTDTSALPYLQDAMIRLLEEYPGCVNGLSRTAQRTLEIICAGESHPGRIFSRYQETEQRRFLGDAGFWDMLHAFLESSPALLKLPEGKQLTLPAEPDQELSITDAGKEALAGQRNWLELMEPNRWLGGVHLTPGNIWCWDSLSSSVIKRG